MPCKYAALEVARFPVEKVRSTRWEAFWRCLVVAAVGGALFFTVYFTTLTVISYRGPGDNGGNNGGRNRRPSAPIIIAPREILRSFRGNNVLA